MILSIYLCDLVDGILCLLAPLLLIVFIIWIEGSDASVLFLFLILHELFNCGTPLIICRANGGQVHTAGSCGCRNSTKCATGNLARFLSCPYNSDWCPEKRNICVQSHLSSRFYSTYLVVLGLFGLNGLLLTRFLSNSFSDGLPETRRRVGRVGGVVKGRAVVRTPNPDSKTSSFDVVNGAKVLLAPVGVSVPSGGVVKGVSVLLPRPMPEPNDGFFLRLGNSFRIRLRPGNLLPALPVCFLTVSVNKIHRNEV